MPVRVLDPRLRAGWEPDTPAADTLLRRFLINWTDSLEAHDAPADGRTLRRDDLAAVDLGRPSFGGNVATLLAPLFQEDVDEVAAVLDDFYGFARGEYSGTAFLFSPWPTPDLRPHGWTLMGREPLMFRPVGGAIPPAPPGLRIEEVRDEAGLWAFERAIVRGFGSPEDLLPSGGEEFGPGIVFSPGILTDDRYRFWVGWEEDRPVCAASAFTGAGLNGVTLVGTVPEARRRGYGAAVTWHATLADPSLPAILLATDEGHPVYERMGYIPLFRFPVWAHERPGNLPEG